MIDDLLNGKPALKFVVWNGETNLGEFTFDSHEFSEYLPDFTPVMIEHLMQDENVQQLCKGYRFSAELNFDIIKGSLLNKLVKLFTALNTGAGSYYDRLEFYPSRDDMPGWVFDIVLSDKEVTTAFMNVIAHKDISLSFKSKILFDHIPLAEELFLSWGNRQLPFSELNDPFSSLT